MNKIEELAEILKSNMVKRDEKKSCPLVKILVVISVIAAAAAVAYAVYRYFKPEVEEELEDDFDEDFDDDFFEDEEAEQIVIPKQEEAEEAPVVEEVTAGE